MAETQEDMDMATKQGLQTFNEAFLSTLDRERKLREQREQFDREMGFRRRQLDLLDAYRQEQIAINKGHLEARQQEGVGRLLERGFTPDVESPEVELFGKGFDYPKFEPEPTTQAETFYEGGNLLERKFIERDGEKITTDINLLKGLTSTSTGKGTGTPSIKEDKLVEFELQSLNALQNPSLTKIVKDEKGDEIEVPMTSDEMRVYLEDNFNVVANNYLSSEAMNWLSQYIKQRGWIPSATEIKEAANRDEDLTDFAAGQLANYLRIHRKIYPGLIKLQSQAGMLP